MTLDDLLRIAGAIGLCGVTAFGAAYLFVTKFASSYLSQKGQNLATREDIGAITDKVEQIRTVYARQLQESTHQNGLLLEELRSRSQLRLVAGEKRLEAHQQAFVLWRELLATGGTANSGEVCDRCLRWWNEHCIYLSPDARQAFSDATFAARLHPSLRQARPGVEGVPDLIANWEKVVRAGDAILAGVDLPPLSSAENAAIRGDTKDPEALEASKGA